MTNKTKGLKMEDEQRLIFDWVQKYDGFWTAYTAYGKMTIFKYEKDEKYSLSISTDPKVMNKLESEDKRAYITRFDSLIECQHYLENLYLA